MRYTAMFAVWIAAVSLVAYHALAWSYSPGEGRTREPERPLGNELQAVVVVHPDCPCTEATLELWSQATQGTSFKTLVLVSGTPKDTKNVSLARRILHGTVQFSQPQEIHRRFGVSTSGHILVWRNRKLVFSGGITDARGEGVKGASFQALSDALKHDGPTVETPVYGCRAYVGEVGK